MKPKAQILVVEDESIVALDIQNRLTRLGYLVPAFVTSGEEAVAKAAKLQPDLILMDIKLKGEIDGIEAAKQIKSLLGIPVIYLTAFADETTLQRAQITEPFGYLIKPFEERELLATIRMAFYRFEAEKQIHESEDKLRSLLEQSGDGIVLVNNLGVIIEWNAAQEKITGLSRAQVIDQPIWDVQYQLMRHDVKQETTLEDIKKRLIEYLQLENVPPDAHAFEIEIELPNGVRKLMQSRNFIIKRDEGHMIGSINRDVTQQKQSEKMILQAQKMESLGVLAGGAAHDFNNLLVVILAQTSLALAKLPLDTPARAHVEKAIHAAEHAADLTQQMLAYSGRGQFETKPVNLNQLAQKNLNLFTTAVPKNVKLQLDLAEYIPYIEADPGQMQQVVMNLILNAAEAIGQELGLVTLSTHVIEVMADGGMFPQWVGEPLLPGHYVQFDVSDNGCGMDAATLAKIFDPFFSTKKLGRGLGLAAVLGIVRGHKGAVQIDSEPGSGTVFHLYFPSIEFDASADVSGDTAVSSAEVAKGAVLIIDDETAVCEAVVDILDFEQITVLTALDGKSGLALFTNRKEEVGLVLLDLSMPGMNGYETFDAIRRIDPDIPVILSSGYDELETSSRFKNQKLDGFLKKPYNLDTLVATIKKHIN